MSQGWDFLLVGVLGAFIGAGELVSRYRDEPSHVFKAPATYAYLVLNISAALAGLGLIRLFDWTFGMAGGGDKLRVMQVLIAGTAAMVLLRSSLFTARIGNQDVGIGPSIFMNVFLAATDRGVDRRRALARDNLVYDLMKDVSFQRAFKILPAQCLALMQNVPPEEQAALGQQVKALTESDLDDHQKARLLGLTLLNLVGERVLQQVVKNLDPEIRRETSPPSPP
jgi:hypothetical protein